MIDRVAAVVAVVLLAVAAALAALIELSLVPLYVNGWLAPVSVPLALAGNWFLPRLARSVVDRTAVMVLVLAAWLVPMIVLALTPRPEGDVYVLGNSAMQWVFYAAFFGGIAVAVVTIVIAAPPAPRLRPRQPAGSLR